MKKAWLLMLCVPAMAWAGAKVSTFNKDSKQGANYWSGGAAIDGKTETAWMVPGESPIRGEWIEVDIPRGDVDKIAILPGYAKNADTFGDYARVKTVRVDIFSQADDQTVSQVGTANLTLADKMELQVLDLPDTKVGGDMFGGKVKISIVDFYPGNDYPSVAISELLIHLKEFDATAKPSGASAESAGHTFDMGSDENPKTFWAAPVAAEGVSFTIDAGGYGLSTIGIQAANKDYARAKTVEITAGNKKLTTVLPDGTDMKWANVPGANGYTGGSIGAVEVKILDTYPGAKSAELGVAEIKVRATNLESF